MDYLEYDRIQADLGAIGDSFAADCDSIISLSNTDPEVKELLTKICKSIESHLNKSAILTSNVASLNVK